jgi:hypothetical protein
MRENANRSVDNLLPLCEEHAFEIDATPDHFSANLLREWKDAQLAEYLELGKSWPLTDAEAAEVAAESFDYHKVGRATAAAASVLSVARLAGLLVETGRFQRRGPQEAASAWQAMREQVNRSSPVFDLDGERLIVEPPRHQNEQYRASLETALADAVTALEPIATQLIAELHAVSAADQRLVPWCDWVEVAVHNALDAAGQWPGPPNSDSDDVWADSLMGLQRASKALTARWRGEAAPEPPPPPPTTPEPAETAEQRSVREHRELLEAARPWARVPHRPYDAELYARLVDAARTVVPLPDIPSLLATGLDSTARLAGKVARNADDSTFRDLIARAAGQQPLVVAVASLRGLMFAARDAEKGALEAEANAAATELLTTQTWQDVEIWDDNRPHIRKLLGWTASVTSNETVQTTLLTAITDYPQLLSSVLLGMTQWVEHRDVNAIGTITGVSFQIDELPPWFPTDAFVAATRESRPNVQAADVDQSARYADDVDRLAAQVLWLASSSTSTG